MPTILTIDHKHYLVPESVNLNVLTKTFGQLKSLTWNYDRAVGEREHYILEDKKPIEVKIEIVPKEKIREPKKPKQIPAKASADCNGPML